MRLGKLAAHGACYHYRGGFSADGEVMDITMTIIASGCAQIEISGQMRRARP